MERTCLDILKNIILFKTSKMDIWPLSLQNMLGNSVLRKLCILGPVSTLWTVTVGGAMSKGEGVEDC